MEELELEEMQDSVDRLLGESELSVEDSLDRLMEGEDPADGTELGEKYNFTDPQGLSGTEGDLDPDADPGAGGGSAV